MEKLTLLQKINHIQKKIKSVHKGSTVKINDKSSYTAVSHDDVTSLLHDPLADIGIVAFPDMVSAEVEPFEIEREYQGKVTISINYRVKVWASVTFFNADNASDNLVTKCFAYALDSGDKATGKAYSMAIKYCFLKTFMLESLDDEESRDNEYQYQKPTPPKPANNYKTEPPSEAQLKAIAAICNKKGIPRPDIKTNGEAFVWINEQNKGR